MNNTVNQAAALIREFNPALASLFIARPFHRETIVVAFERGFIKHSEYTRKVCQLVANLAKIDKLDRPHGKQPTRQP